MGYEGFIAWKHLTRRRRSGFISLITTISILGVGVGVMALIVVLAVMSGFDRELKEKIVGVNPHIYIESAGGIEDPDAVVRAIQGMQIAGMQSVARVVQGQALIRSQSNAIGVVVKGVDRENHELDELKGYIQNGSFDFSETVLPKMDPLPAVIVGKELAQILRVG